MKFFTFLVILAIILFVQPILICLKIDDYYAYPWGIILLPIWFLNLLIQYLAISKILLEGTDKMKFFNIQLKIILALLFQLFLTLKLDEIWWQYPWSFIFAPLIILQFWRLALSIPSAYKNVTTIDEQEDLFGMPLEEISLSERKKMFRNNHVAPSTKSPEFIMLHDLKRNALGNVYKNSVVIAMIIMLVWRLDYGSHWSWWFISSPFWTIPTFTCYLTYNQVKFLRGKLDTNDYVLNSVEHNRNRSFGFDETTMEEANDSTFYDDEMGQEKLKVDYEESIKLMKITFFIHILYLIFFFLLILKVIGAKFPTIFVLVPLLFPMSIVLVYIVFTSCLLLSCNISLH